MLARAAAFGIAHDRRPARDPLALRGHMREVVERIRRDGRPFFQVLDTFRLMAHSKGDDDRDPDLIANARREDPLDHLRTLLDARRAAAIDAEIQARVDARRRGGGRGAVRDDRRRRRGTVPAAPARHGDLGLCARRPGRR